MRDEKKTMDKVRSAAEGIRKEFGIEGRPCGAEDFFKICESRQVYVARPGMIPELDAIAAKLPATSFAFLTEGRFCVFLRSLFTGDGIDMRTAMHELGHIELGHLDGAPPTFARFLVKPKEAEADRFAALMLAFD